MTTLRAGTVTVLFTEIEGGDRLLGQFGERHADIVADYRRLLRVAGSAAIASTRRILFRPSRGRAMTLSSRSKRSRDVRTIFACARSDTVNMQIREMRLRRAELSFARFPGESGRENHL